MRGGRHAEWPARLGRARQAGLVKGVLLFLAGLFAGANLLYFVLSRQPSQAGTPPANAIPAPVVPAAGPTRPPASTGPAPTGTPDVPGGRAYDRPGASVPPPVPTVPPTSPGAVTAGQQPLLIPVQGILASQLQDTFNDARAQGRSHEAIDIMAPAGTPVLAAADGAVEKLFTSDAGGLTVYQFEPSGRYAYYYAHLQGYAPGLAEKQALRRGDVIGYVGSTGNANPAAPHLHFAVFVLGPERRWWQGTAINPYPLLHRP